LATLEEVFEKYSNYSPLPICYIDIKPYYDTVNFQSYADYVQAYSQTMNTLISKYNRYEHTLLSSGDTYMLQRLHMISPSLKLTIDNPDFNTAFQIATSLGLFGITIHYKNITRAMVEKAHANNLRIIIWGVNTKSACRQTASLFPDYVETDNVMYMLSLAK
jgi:glycerophosphoryl diester phosphodiesterase